jgi:glycosyltransferase involved in cell wall biosynthesis
MGVLGAAVAKDTPTPVVHTVSDAVSRTRDVWTRAARHAPHAKLISISQRQQELAPNLPWIANCPNAIDLEHFEFHESADGYTVFLGRMSPDKGCDVAIDVARRVGIPLKIGAKLRDEHEQEYFEEEVRPLLDGEVEFLGEVSQKEKVKLLGHATAALFPSEVEEAFGLVHGLCRRRRGRDGRRARADRPDRPRRVPPPRRAPLLARAPGQPLRAGVSPSSRSRGARLTR